MEHKWVHSSAYSSLPPNAVVGGNDIDGDMLYVGRSFHNGDLLPAKIVPAKHIAFVSWRGEELPKDHFEVLCGTTLAWRHCYDHVIPENAVVCGSTALGQPIYIGRGHYEGNLTIGKVSSVHRALFIPFYGAERRLESYEILVEEKPDSGWRVPTPTTPLPPLPPPLEEKPLGSPAPPAPATWEKPPCPYPTEDAKPLGFPTAYTPMPQPQPQQLPAGPHYAPPPYSPAPTYAPPPPPYTVEPAPHHHHHHHHHHHQPHSHSHSPSRPYDMWVNASASYSPPNAVHAGHDSDLAPLVVCRAFHCGDLLPGKAVPSRGCAYVAFAGQELPKAHFEVLVGEGYDWVPAGEGHVPPGAVEAGRTAAGEPLYVGRGHYGGSLTPGKVQRSHCCLYIAYGGREVRLPHYEVLVRRGDHYHQQAMKMHY